MLFTLIIHTDFYIRSNRQRVFACLGAIQPPVVFAVYVPCQVSVCSAQEYRKPLFVFVGKYDVCFQNAVCAERVIIALKGRCYFNGSTLGGISGGIGEVQFDSLRHRFLGLDLSRKIRAAEAEALRRNISAVLVCGIDGDRIASGCECLHGQGDLAACIQPEIQFVALAAENTRDAVKRAFKGKFQHFPLWKTEDALPPYPDMLERYKVGIVAKAGVQLSIISGLFGDEQLELTLSPEECKRIFHFSYPLFRNENESAHLNGYNRYWKNPVSINGISYLVCKEWFESNRKYLIFWLRQMNVALVNAPERKRKAL